jgi:uncharacterized membrane protein
MNKEVFLRELTDRLRTGQVSDIEEIVAEYDEHFDRKRADGYTEDEIAAKLGSPKEIALQFAAAESRPEKRKSNKVISAIGLFFSDLVVIPFFITMYAWCFVVGALSLASAVYGICLILRPLLPTDIVIIPPMPYGGGVLFGAAMIALGVLAAVAAVYSVMLTVQMGRVYRRWHKNVMSDGKYPPYSMHPVLKDHLRRRLRSIGLIALMIFVVTFIIGFVVLSICAGTPGFWHAWHWFV